MKGKVSKTGYKRNSPDRNNDYNIIPSGRITMQDVDFPVYGMDNYGNAMVMYPGGEYNFPGNQVFEIPMFQRGGGNDRAMVEGVADILSMVDSSKNRKEIARRMVQQFEDEGVNYQLSDFLNRANVTGYQKLPMAQLGMSTRRIDRILNENKDLNWVQRLYEPNTPSIQISGQPGPSTHFMESADGKVYPTVVQMPDGQLQYLGDDAYEYAMQTGEYIQFKNDRQAQRFAKNYKKGTDVLKEYGKGGLTQWFAEKWVDVKTGKECGRSGKDKDGRPYPACRPSRRVNETTPKTASEMSAAEKARFKGEKTSGKRIDYNHERAQDGKEVKPQPTSWGDYMNPMNWGVYTYDDAGTFKQAFAQARQDGQDEFMWYGKRYTTELAAPAKPKPTAAPQQPNMDFEALKRGVAYVESKNGKFMWNPESSATGLYGQRFSEIKGTPVYDGTREQFKTDVDAQNKVFELRYSGELPGYNTGLKQDALDLYKEYYPIVKKNNIQPIELAALSNFLGRQGARYYLGYVLRDGKSLAQALPDIYGGNAGQTNKTPEQYLAEFRKAAYASKQEDGGEIENYPDYSDYDDYSMAWLAARRELGKNKMFKYGGMVSSTCTPTGL